MRVTFRMAGLLCAAACLTGCGKGGSNRVTLAVANEAQAEPAKEAKPEARPKFAFAADDAGKMLATMLSGDAVSSARPRAQSGPISLKAPAALETPDIRLPHEMVNAALPQVRIKDDPRKKLKPRMLPGDPPLSRQAYDITPRRDDLPVSPLSRVYSSDVEIVQPVPTLSQSLPDRASLDDPTGGFSLASVLLTSAPERPSPAPPWFLNLPDPFEHHRVVKIEALPVEDSAPPR